MKLLLIIIFTLNAKIVFSQNQINWQNEGNGIFAYGCDFSLNQNLLTNASTLLQQCGQQCKSTPSCTHYRWTSDAGGTCLMKSGTVNKQDAFTNGRTDMICGIITTDSITTTDGPPKCDEGWLERPFSSYCYRLYTELISFESASIYCRANGGEIASITSVEEQLYIQTIINSDFWLGANRESANKGWVWKDESPFIFTNWDQGEYITGSNQYCAIISSSISGQWKTVKCTELKYNSLCKKVSTYRPIIPPTTVYPIDPNSNYACDEGWSQNYKTNFCYKYFGTKNDMVSFNKARDTCKQDYNSDLVEILSENENQFVISLLESENLKVYNSNSNQNTVKTNTISRPKIGCPGGWQLQNNQCFKSVDDTKDWNLAQKYCKNQGGYLATVKSISDNSILIQIANKTRGDIWIGLKRSKNTNSWVLSDNTDQFYTNWDVNFPTNSNLNDRCAVLRINGNNKWFDVDCVQTTQSFNFICQQDPAVQDACTEYFHDTFGTNGQCLNKGQCPNSHYITGLCGDYNDPDVECCFDSQKDKQGVWIGMYDELSGFNQISFKLLSGMTPTYTNWAPNEPLAEGECVAMHKKDSSTFLNPSFNLGQWMVNKCDFKNRFICKKPVSRSQTIPTTSSTAGCPQGFNGYQTRCFKTVQNELTWEEAESNCIQMGSNLVSIMDKFEQSWLTQNQLNSGLKWIGLSDKTSIGTYTWSNNDRVNFTNWDRNKPDQSDGRCIAMNSAGFWTNYNCSTSKFQSICMSYNHIYTTPTTPSTLPPPPCASGWTEQDNNCYKLFGPKNQSEMLNWYDAEAFCNHLDGNLASFRSLTAQTNVLARQNANSFGQDYTFWFGLSKLEQSKGYQYSDGSAVSFTNWDYLEPSNTNGRENCADIKASYGNKWRDFYCYTRKGWICTIPRGIEPNSTDFNPPTFEIVECTNNTDYKWTLYKNKCYYVSTGVDKEKLSWQKSREFCRNINGDLVSIHTEQELQYITTIVSSKLDRWHIGLSQFTPNSGFVWSDGSPVNFVNWAPGEPNNANGGEKCAEMLSTNSFWNDGKCGAEQGFVCEKSNRTTFIQSEDVLPLSFTSDNNGNLCPDGFSTFGIQTKNNKGEQKPCSFPFKYNGQYYYECVTFENRNPWCATTSDYDADKEWGYCVDIKCFKVVTTKMNYGQGRSQCEKDGASLASIHNELEHSYVTALLRKNMNLNMDYWIGLWSPGGTTGNTFLYEDNSELTFTKWGPGKPGNNFYNERCVVMSGDSSKAGLWQNVDGNRAHGFICSQYSNGVKFITSCQTSNRSIVLTCPSDQTIMITKADFGREAYSMTCDNDYYYDSCTSSDQTTEKVRSLCQSKATCNLTSSNTTFNDNCPSVVKQLKVWYQCVKTPILTTGGNSNGASCVFPFTYKNVLRHQCTYEQHPDYVNKKWCCTNSNCDNDFKWGICPESKSPLDSSNCSRTDYTSIDSGKNCYKVFDSDLKTWKEAKEFCEQTEGGKLVSIVDGFEQAYIRLLSYTSFSMSNPWIGLIRNNTENYFWSDDWQLEYTNWATGLEIDSLSESCGYFNSSTGTWSSTSCDDKKSYICKISKEMPPALTTAAPGKCPDGATWTAFGSSCYSYELTNSYLNAKYICGQKGAYVTSIHSQEELDFINSLTSSGTIWIGLEKNPLTSKYEWNDGSSLGFSKFPTTPVQVQGTNCVYMYSSIWTDYNCLTNFRFVCKRSKIFDSTTLITNTTTSTTNNTTKITTSTTATKITGNITFSSSTSQKTSNPTTEKISKSTTQVIVTKKPENLGNEALYGIIGGVIIAVLAALVITLVVLKKKGIIKKDLPFMKFTNNSDFNETSYTKHSESISIKNPSYS